MISYDNELQLHQMDKIPAFEGWYFRVVDNKVSVAVIIGIAKTHEEKTSFIQIFHTFNQVMEKVSYSIDDFHYQVDPFMITIKKSIFKKHYIHIEDERLSTVIDLELDIPQKIHQTPYAPTIMGPFAYLKNMQCNHAVINLGCSTKGYMKYLDRRYNIDGIIYQEKDWGYSFPKKYIWIQSNCCREKEAILFLSCATIPLKSFGFTGVVMTLIIDGKEYHFASYYGAYVIKNKKVNDIYSLKIKQGKYIIEFQMKMGPLYILDAPENGLMERSVEECLLGKVKLKLYKSKQCIEDLSFHHCGIENDNFFI